MPIHSTLASRGREGWQSCCSGICTCEAQLQTSLTWAIKAPSETRMGKQCDGVRENATLLAALERARRHLAIHGTMFVLSARILPDKDAGVLRRLKAKRM